jgi:aspartate-semialdehyde dehydrogenase
LKKRGEVEELIQAWRQFRSESQRLPLPTAPFHPLYYLSDPQAVHSDKEMSVYIEQLCPSQVFDYTFNLFFSHTMRGVIGSMLLNAELLVAQGYIYW